MFELDLFDLVTLDHTYVLIERSMLCVKLVLFEYASALSGEGRKIYLTDSPEVGRY